MKVCSSLKDSNNVFHSTIKFKIINMLIFVFIFCFMVRIQSVVEKS